MIEFPAVDALRMTINVYCIVNKIAFWNDKIRWDRISNCGCS